MKDFLDSILDRVPDVIFAIILLIIAFVAAKIVKTIVTKLLKAVHAEEFLSKLGVKDTATNSSIEFIAKLVYFVTFLLFLPGVLDKLGMQSVSSPITGMVNDFLAFIPKLVSAGIVIAVGIFIAKIVKDLLVPVLKAIKVDTLQEKAGISAEGNTSVSSIIANIVYGIIVLVVITTAFDQLGIKAISAPANDVVNAIFNAMPNVFCAIVIIAIGIFIANLVGSLLQSLLAGVGTDTLIEKITGEPAKKVVLSKVISGVVKYILVIVFLVQGVNVLNLPILTNLGAAIIAYLPQLISAVIIVAIGFFAASTAETAISKKFPEAKGAAIAAKVAIYVLTAFLCLSQLNVANKIVETTFILIIAAVCVAFAVAFGIGGRTFAANRLEKLEKKIDDKGTDKEAE